ncbi:MAG: T9SS type A sorting domain-containing protein [Salibacteraceae bacterium]
MKKLLLSFSFLSLATLASAQITITQADYGSAGDSIVIGTDNAAPANLSVGGTGMQTWDYTMLALNNINILNFVDPSTTISGSAFPNADLAIERLTDTLFFTSSAASFDVDGVTGDGFGLGVSLQVDFKPNSTQMQFPATLNDNYIDTAVFDTTVSCQEFGFGGFCDSARIKRKLIATSEIDAYGSIQTPGGTFNSIRQYFREFNQDTIWTKVPFLGWQIFTDSQSVVHNYRWMANDEKWPVLNAIADAQNGDIISAEYVIGDQVLGFANSEIDPSCNGDCDGSASIYAVGGQPPYSYSWPDGQTTAMATGLCAGNYIVTIEDSDTSSYEVEIQLNDPSPISIAGAVQGVNVDDDGAIDVTVSGGAGGYTYEWSGPDGYTATTADIGDLEPGEYTLIATDQNDCDTSKSFLVELTGIRTAEESGFNVFPNPANEQFTVRSNNLIQHITMSDLLGNVMLNQRPMKNTVEINTLSIAQGIYIIEVETESGVFLNKLTIRH